MTAELKQKTVVVSTIDEIKKLTDAFRGGTIGLVPTMGYLHNGHMNLVKQSLNKCDHTVVSIFINPKQFSPSEDLDIYPNNLSGDIEKLESIGVDVLFSPNTDTIYPEGFKTNIQVDGPAQISALIDQTPEISEQITLWGQSGSKVVMGRIIIMPVEESILYIQPVYLAATSKTGFPQLSKVIVAMNHRVAMDDSLELAFKKLEQKVMATNH